MRLVLLNLLFLTPFVYLWYMICRNEWVMKRRRELIEWHFANQIRMLGNKNPWDRAFNRVNSAKDFDSVYGSYDFWLINRWWCWNPAKIAGLERWFPGDK